MVGTVGVFSGAGRGGGGVMVMAGGAVGPLSRISFYSGTSLSKGTWTDLKFVGFNII